MTQWFRDFSEYSEGDLSSVGSADWSVSTLTGSWYVIVDSTGGAAGEDACVADNDVSSDANAFAWFDASATTGDIECYCKFSNDGSYDTNVGFGPAIMQTDNQCYALAANGATDTRLLRFGTAGTASQVLGSTTFALSASTVYHAIVGRSGTSIYAYIWADGDSQPGSPQISATNTVLGSVSGAIFCRDGSMAPQRTTAFGVGTAGDAAPQSGGGGGTTVNLSGVSSTGAAGDPTVTGGAAVTISGASASGASGSITATGGAIVALAGVSAAGAAGVVTATGAANITITGVDATGAAGSIAVTVGGAVNVSLNGVSATGAIGSPVVTGAASVSVAGASATGSAGTITATIGSVVVTLSGVSATGSVGTLTITGGAAVSMLGVSATGRAGAITASVPGSEAFIDATITITPAIGGTLTLQPAIDGDITIN